jgi:D-xylose transport system substrate-binding protein
MTARGADLRYFFGVKRIKRSMLAAAVTAGLALTVTACGGGDDAKIALLLPGLQPPRYEAANRVDFEKGVEENCDDCEVLYSNAGRDTFKQGRQVKVALRQGVDALALGPVDPIYAVEMVEEARAKGVPVLDYGHLIPQSRPDASVSFDYTKTGELQAEMLAEQLRAEGHPKGPIMMIKGEPGNRDQRFFEEGAHQVLAAEGVRIAKEYYTPFWSERNAEYAMKVGIKSVGADGFAGVYAETDSIAGGAIAAMKSAGIDPAERPTTGRNASVAAMQRILDGEQYMTAYEPLGRLAAVGAEIAVDLARGEPLPQGQSEVKVFKGRVHSVLVGPVAVTKSSIARIAMADGIVSASEFCDGAYRERCEEAGIPGI